MDKENLPLLVFGPFPASLRRMTLALLLWLEAFRLFGAGFFYFAHAALTALGALSPLEASLALAFRLLAEPLFALYGGHLADRWPRGRLLLLLAGGLLLALAPWVGRGWR